MTSRVSQDRAVRGVRGEWSNREEKRMSLWIRFAFPLMKSLAILVVDDHAIMREVVCEMLEDAGHQVRFAADGHEALRKLSCARFDVLVTDIVMPGMDGIELIGEVRRRYPDIRIIAMSGGGERFPTHDGLTIARRLGAGVTLNKPFLAEQLIDAVEQVCPQDAWAV